MVYEKILLMTISIENGLFQEFQHIQSQTIVYLLLNKHHSSQANVILSAKQLERWMITKTYTTHELYYLYYQITYYAQVYITYYFYNQSKNWISRRDFHIHAEYKNHPLNCIMSILFSHRVWSIELAKGQQVAETLLLIRLGQLAGFYVVFLIM